MSYFFKRIKKSFDFETEVLERLEALEHDKAFLRQDIRAIIREEIMNVLNARNRRAWSDIA
jgi:hypothetical protein